MQPVTEFTPEHLDYWDGLNPKPVVFRPPPGSNDCDPALSIVTTSESDMKVQVVRTAWKPDEIDLAALAQGGTVWLSTWGSLPPHMLEVQPPA